MSGPKVSSYELERRRREEEARRLEELRRQEEKRIEEEKRATLNRIKELQKVLGQHKERLIGYKRDAEYVSSYQNVDNVLSELGRDIDELNTGGSPSMADSIPVLHNFENKLINADEKAKLRIEHYEQEKTRWDENLDKVFSDALGDLVKEDVVTEEVKTVETVNVANDERILQEQEKAGEIAGLIREKMQEFAESRELSMEISRHQKVFDNLAKLGDFHGAIDFYYQKEAEMARAVSSFLEEKNKLENTILSYTSACSIAGCDMEEAPETLSVSDKAKWYEEKRIEIESQFLEKREQEIIRDELSSVMEELGYHVIAEKETVRKSGRQIHEKVFSFGEGSGVNITEAGGQITMEVVGLDTANRAPEADEQEYLESEMVSFCSAHKDIEEKLKERGIVLKNRIQMNKPSKEYAKILNVTSYEQKSKNISMIQSRSKTNKKSSASAAEAIKRNI